MGKMVLGQLGIGHLWQGQNDTDEMAKISIKFNFYLVTKSQINNTDTKERAETLK